MDDSTGLTDQRDRSDAETRRTDTTCRMDCSGRRPP